MADTNDVHGLSLESSRTNAVLRGMAKHPDLCFILLSLLLSFLSNYGSSFSFKSKPLVLPARIPQPLFPKSSPVLDLNLGDLRPLVDMLYHEDLIFVMYYAPWCARSKAVVTQFSRAARYLEGKVRFVAVNCWFPEGLCRKQYKFLFYPAFFAYHNDNNGYRYVGIQRAEFMVKFLEDLLQPLTILQSIEEVKDFVTQHDTVVVGYFDFNSSPQPPGYQQFYFASMRVVEHDSFQPVKFGIIVDTYLANFWNLTSASNIVFLRINNSSLKYPYTNNITSSNIVSWVFMNRYHLPVRWLVPLGVKSLVLSREINQGPVVIMFHRVNPLSKASQPFAAFKHLALSYNQCSGDSQASDASKRWLTLSVRNMIQHAKTLNTCRNLSKEITLPVSIFKCCMSTKAEIVQKFPDIFFNVCEICKFTPSSEQYIPDTCAFSKSAIEKANQTVVVVPLPSNMCFNSIDTYDTYYHTSICCRHCSKNVSLSDLSSVPSSQFASSQGRRLTDRYVLEALEKLPRKLCDQMTFQKQQETFPTSVIQDFSSSTLPEEFLGLGCRSNRSLNFISLDSHNHWVFAESLGLDVSQAHVNPVVVAFDKENEEQYILKEQFSKKSTASFILNFAKGILRRNLRTLPSSSETVCTEAGSLCLTELTTDSFQTVVLQPKDVVVLVYSGWCGFCLAVSHTFLHLAYYFRTSSNIIFARINGETNDLPWEVSMDSYPSILFFPAHNKADSMKFPENTSITLPNLIRFIFEYTTFTTRLQLAADVCSSDCIQQNIDTARHTLHVLLSKLRQLRKRAARTQTASEGRELQIQITLKLFVVNQIAEIQNKITTVRTLMAFLESSNSKRLDSEKLEKLFGNEQGL